MCKILFSFDISGQRVYSSISTRLRTSNFFRRRPLMNGYYTMYVHVHWNNFFPRQQIFFFIRYNYSKHISVLYINNNMGFLFFILSSTYFSLYIRNRFIFRPFSPSQHIIYCLYYSILLVFKVIRYFFSIRLKII